MDFFALVVFCILAWVSGACFGLWLGSRPPRKARQSRRGYFEEEADMWRPFRRLARRATSVGLGLVALLVTLAFVAFLSQSHRSEGFNHRHAAAHAPG